MAGKSPRFDQSRFFQNLFETSPLGIVCQIASGEIVAGNPAAERILGLTLEQMQGRTSSDPRWLAIHEDGSPFAGEAHPSMIALREGREVRDVVMGVFHPGWEEYRWIRIAAIPQFKTGRAQPFQVFTIFEDITEQRRVETQNRAFWNNLTALYEASLAFGQLPDAAAIGREVIRALEHILKWERGSLWIKGPEPGTLRLLAHSDMSLVADALDSEMDRVRGLVPREGVGISGWVAQHGLTVLSGDVRNDPRYVEADPRIRSELCVPLRVAGDTIGSINVESVEPHFFHPSDEKLLMTIATQAAVAIKNASLIEDMKNEISERTAIEEKLRISLEEKTILLREVHHRVKNNLQMISSLLRLQAERQPDVGYKMLVRANQSRIRSLGLIHEKLYASDLTRVDLADYAESLAAYLYQFHGVDSRRVVFRLDPAPITLDLQTAIPIGLILNELLENSLRHAFPDHREGTIRLGLGTLPDGEFEMIVADDGRGVPDEVNLPEAETLGWTLIRLLTGQIDGRIETETARGLSVRIVFKEVEYKKRF